MQIERKVGKRISREKHTSELQLSPVQDGEGDDIKKRVCE